MAILADVAPYSREYNTYRQKIGKETQDNTELEIEYEKILKRVKQTRESVIRMQDRHFTTPVDEIFGTVDEVSAGGITLNEYPGRLFQFSSVSTSAADMSARILGENNIMTRSLHPARPKRPRARGLDQSCARPRIHDPASSFSGALMLLKAASLHGLFILPKLKPLPAHAGPKPHIPRCCHALCGCHSFCHWIEVRRHCLAGFRLDDPSSIDGLLVGRYNFPVRWIGLLFLLLLLVLPGARPSPRP